MFVDPFGLMNESDIAHNYFYVSFLMYNIVDNNKNLFPELKDLYKTDISSNGIELWNSVLAGDTSVSGCIYVPEGNNYNYKAGGNGIQIYGDTCWACCEVFVMNFNNPDITDAEFQKQVSEMYERNGCPPSGSVNSMNPKNFPSFAIITKRLEESGGPIYGIVDSMNPHSIVIIGSYQYKGKMNVIYYDCNETNVIIDAEYDEKNHKLNGKDLITISNVDYEKFD